MSQILTKFWKNSRKQEKKSIHKIFVIRKESRPTLTHFVIRVLAEIFSLAQGTFFKKLYTSFLKY